MGFCFIGLKESEVPVDTVDWGSLVGKVVRISWDEDKLKSGDPQADRVRDSQIMEPIGTFTSSLRHPGVVEVFIAWREVVERVPVYGGVVRGRDGKLRALDIHILEWGYVEFRQLGRITHPSRIVSISVDRLRRDGILHEMSRDVALRWMVISNLVESHYAAEHRLAMWVHGKVMCRISGYALASATAYLAHPAIGVPSAVAAALFGAWIVESLTRIYGIAIHQRVWQTRETYRQIV